jgi:ABC-type transport system substrate-binding protein
VVALAQVGSTDEPPADIEVATPSTIGAAAAGAQPADDDVAEPFVYRIGVLSGISTDNFWAYYGSQPSVWNSYILGPTKPTLFSLDPVSGGLTPELVTGDATPVWDADGWRVTVEMDDRFTWSDGVPVTAEDLAYTFSVVRSLGLEGSWSDAFPSAVESIEAHDGNQIVIEFSERPTLSVWPYGVGLAPVMPRHVWADLTIGVSAEELYATPGERDVSGGPLTLSEWSEALIVSTANPGYPGAIGADSVEYHVLPDEPALVSAVADGVVDSILSPNGVAPDQVAAVDDEPGVEVVANPANGIRYLGFNLSRQPMSSNAFRTALALLVDREDLAERIPRTGEVAWSLVPSSNLQWFDEEQAGSYRARFSGDLATRLQEAITGLIAAGYAWAQTPSVAADGSLVAGAGLTIQGQTPQPLTILTPGDTYDPARPEYVAEIAETLTVLGFDARPVETDFDTVVDLAFTPGDDGALHYDMYLLGWTLGNPALPGYYRPFFTPEGEMNNTGYDSLAFTEALADYETAVSTDEARNALWDMEAALSTDLPYLPLYTSELTEMYRSDRVEFGIKRSLGGLQGRLGGIGDVRPID